MSQPFTFCLVPPELAEHLLEPLREHFAADPHLAVIVERRAPDEPVNVDDRVRRALSRAKAERRAPQLPRDLLDRLTPELCERAQTEVRFSQRLLPVARELEDVPLPAVVEHVRAGDAGAPSELLWRLYERVRRRLELELRDRRLAEMAVKGAFGRILDALPGYDPAVHELLPWVDAVVDAYAATVEHPALGLSR